MRQEIFHAGQGGLGELERTWTVNLAVAPLWLDGKPGITSGLEVAIYILGTVGTAAGGLLIVWRIIRPHVVAFLDKRIAAVQGTVEKVGEQLQHQVPAEDQHQELVAAVRDVRQQVGRVHRRMDKHQAQQQHTHQLLQTHVEESQEYLERATELLNVQGVKLPPFSKTGRESDEET